MGANVPPLDVNCILYRKRYALRKVGQYLGIIRERVRQIQNRAWPRVGRRHGADGSDVR